MTIYNSQNMSQFLRKIKISFVPQNRGGTYKWGKGELIPMLNYLRSFLKYATNNSTFTYRNLLILN
jgi:hypothetical protein